MYASRLTRGGARAKYLGPGPVREGGEILIRHLVMGATIKRAGHP